jgi:hypothetical protein
MSTTAATTQTAVPRRVAGVRFRRVGKSLILIVADRVYELNVTAEAAWLSIDGVKTVGAIAEEIAARYGQDLEVVSADVAELMDMLVSLRAVEILAA